MFRKIQVRGEPDAGKPLGDGLQRLSGIFCMKVVAGIEFVFLEILTALYAGSVEGVT